MNEAYIDVCNTTFEAPQDVNTDSDTYTIKVTIDLAYRAAHEYNGPHYGVST
jgi:hypothetical protein